MLDSVWTVTVIYCGICIPRDFSTGRYCLKYLISICPPDSLNCLQRRFEAYIVIAGNWILEYDLFEIPPPPPYPVGRQIRRFVQYRNI